MHSYSDPRDWDDQDDKDTEDLGEWGMSVRDTDDDAEAADEDELTPLASATPVEEDEVGTGGLHDLDKDDDGKDDDLEDQLDEEELDMGVEEEE